MLIENKRYSIISCLRILSCILIICSHYMTNMFTLPELLRKGVVGPVAVFMVVSAFWHMVGA